MAQQTINSTDSPETGRGKINDNFDELYANKRYSALLIQAGTDAPVATVFENTLSGSIIWTYTAVGIYTGTLSSAFTSNKTKISISYGFTKDEFENSIVIPCGAQVASADSIVILTGNPLQDGTNFAQYINIEIVVYP